MINHNNYEEYLLLYIDGELSSAERQAVEVFVAANPEIASELEALQQTVLSPAEDISFVQKEVLYREATGIHLDNYESWFMMYVDNELNAAEKQAVETFVLQQPQLQDEFTLLKQTVLPNEWVVFENKAVLYRKEEKRRPIVIGMRWASLAAAVLIALIAFIWIFRTGSPSTTDTFAGKTKVPAVQEKANTGSNNDKAITTAEPENKSLAAATAGTIPQQLPASEKKTPKVGNKVQQVPTLGTNQQLAVVEPPVVPSANTDNTHPSTTVASTGNTVTPGSGGKKTEPVYSGTPEVANVNYGVQPASYTEELESDDNKHKNLYVGALEINSSKVRGFFRKAGRFLSNKVKNKNSDEKLQVANLEVNKL